MNGAEHYRGAEELLDEAALLDWDNPAERSILAAAQVHATLALAAATADPWGDHWKQAIA